MASCVGSLVMSCWAADMPDVSHYSWRHHTQQAWSAAFPVNQLRVATVEGVLIYVLTATLIVLTVVGTVVPTLLAARRKRRYDGIEELEALLVNSEKTVQGYIRKHEQDVQLLLGDVAVQLDSVLHVPGMAHVFKTTIPAGESMGKHAHDSSEVFYISRGAMEVTVYGVLEGTPSTDFTLRSGDSLVVEPRTVHSVHWLEDTDHLTITIPPALEYVPDANEES